MARMDSNTRIFVALVRILPKKSAVAAQTSGTAVVATMTCRPGLWRLYLHGQILARGRDVTGVPSDGTADLTIGRIDQT